MYMSNMLNSLKHGARLRDIAMQNIIAVSSAHTVLTEHMYIINGFSVI